MTDYINGDNDILHFNSGVKSSLRFSAIQSDKSYIVGVRSYPINVEIKTVKTYSRSATPTAGGFGGGGSGAGNMTVELNSSFVLLPKVPMQARYFDPRVGYFAVGYTDYDANPQGVKSISIVKRWNLEPKDVDMEKYKRGELVEPKKQIVFYIDPATPKKWDTLFNSWCKRLAGLLLKKQDLKMLSLQKWLRPKKKIVHGALMMPVTLQLFINHLILPMLAGPVFLIREVVK
jgi:hypothetical protein